MRRFKGASLMAGIPENPNPAVDNDLKQTLGPIHLIALGIGAIIGAGIFVLTGHAAASYAGSGVVISFAIAGTGCLFAGLCYAEYAAMIPVAGSAYTYTFATMGRFLAWIIGWNLVLEYLAAGSTVAVGWSGYFSDFMSSQLHTPIPLAFAGAPFKLEGFHHFVATGAYFNLPAVLLVALVTFVLIVGVNMSATFNSIMVAIKLCIVIAVIFVGFSHVNPANHVPFIPANTGTFGQFGWTGIFRATGVIFFAYIGFDAVSVAAQEARNPQRDVPFGILGSLAICTVLYMLMSWVLTGLAPYATLNVAHPGFDGSGSDPGHPVAGALRQCGRDRGPCFRRARAAAGPVAHLLCDGEGRNDPASVQRDPSALPHALARYDHHWRVLRIDGGCVAARYPGRTGFDRHAGRLCHRLRRRDGAARAAPEREASVPYAAGLVRRARSGSACASS